MGRLPYPLPFAQELALDHYDDASATSEPAADGSCTASIGPVPDGETWRVERLVVVCDSTTGTLAHVYAGDPHARNLVDATSSGNLDVADEDQPVLLEAGQTLTCEWTGASTGAVGTFNAQWAVYVRRTAR